MSETAATNLRQANASVEVAGIVSSKDLKFDQKDGSKVITGSVYVEIDETNIVRFGVYAKEKTNKGESNPAYQGLLTVMNEYRTIADNGREHADKVYVKGDLSPYVAQNGKEAVSQKASFFNRVQKIENYSPKAEFEVEVYIASLVPEVDKEGTETGRLLVKGWVPTYSGIEPITLVAPEDLAESIQNMFEADQTVEFSGDLINNRVEIRTEIPMAIGKPKIKTETSYKNELRITGASEAYEEGVTAEKPYDKETIRLAINEHKAKQEAKQREANSGNTASYTRPSASGTGRQMSW